MPKIKSWSARIPVILQHLGLDGRALYTRAEIERMFELGRSQATDIMHIAGSDIRNGAQATVSADNLRYYVEHCPEAQAFLDEEDRKAKLAKRLQQTTEELRQRAIPIPGAGPADEWTHWRDLTNVALEQGLMRIAFSSYDELLRSLWLISRALANEPEPLRGMCAPAAAAEAPRGAGCAGHGRVKFRGPNPTPAVYFCPRAGAPRARITRQNRAQVVDSRCAQTIDGAPAKGRNVRFCLARAFAVFVEGFCAHPKIPEKIARIPLT